MKKKINPKALAGILAVAVLTVLLIPVLVTNVRTAEKVAYEKSLTPTPLPPFGNVMAVTPDPSAPTREPMLRTGSAGQAVTDLQSRLFILGYYTGAIDGQYGPGTKEAVTAFQKQNGLSADGIVGTETKTLLFSADAKPYSAAQGE
ncbi:MAG: peptidoglycan-binding domain-containing protein [Clostridia bacterium]|nr:peptidoglycan-binding domain-containing protein [Clostridia bacterium]